MRGLRGCMNDRVRSNFGYEAQHAWAIPDIDLEMRVIGDVRSQPLKRPARIAFGPEKDRSLVVIDAKYPETMPREMEADLGAD